MDSKLLHLLYLDWNAIFNGGYSRDFNEMTLQLISSGSRLAKKSSSKLGMFRPNKKQCAIQVCSMKDDSQDHNRKGSFGEDDRFHEDEHPKISLPDAVPVVTREDDWREFRAKLVASSTSSLAGWAHVLARPETGCVLLANPLMFTTSQTYFNKAAIFVFSHGEEGSAGLILNKPTEHKMNKFKDSSTLPDEYDDCRLYLGGDVGADVVNLLHGVTGVEDSTEILPGVYMGGVQGVSRALASNATEHGNVKIFTRYAGWARHQLEEEVQRGVWIVAAVSKDIVLRPVSPSASADLWHEILQLMGGEYAGLSDAVREEYRPDIMEYQPEVECEGAQEEPSSFPGDDFGDHTHGSGI